MQTKGKWGGGHCEFAIADLSEIGRINGKSQRVARHADT